MWEGTDVLKGDGTTRIHEEHKIETSLSRQGLFHHRGQEAVV